MQTKQRQSFLLNNNEEGIAMPRSENTSVINTNNSRSKSPRNSKMLPDISHLVGRNSFSLPSFQSNHSGEKVVQSSDQMTQSLLGAGKNRQLCHRKSAPVMGPSLTKENNTDPVS